MLYEGYHHPITNLVSDGFKKYLIPPISNEYEEEYLDVMPKSPIVGFVISGPVNEENSIAIQGQKAENKEDSECVESDSFPLCYASFELLRLILKISKKVQKLEDMTFSKIDNEKG